MAIASETRLPAARDLRPVGYVSIAVALVLATWIAAHTWREVRAQPQVPTMQVTGSAKKRITSDLIEWSAQVEAVAPSRADAYKTLHDHVARATAFLAKAGVKAEDLRVSSVTVEPQYQTHIEGHGEGRIERRSLTGYLTRQAVVVRSTDVALVERMSREITALLEQGVTITSMPPQYFYTKIGEVKVEMLAEAAKDARSRAENILRSAGGAGLGRLRGANMGVININPANSQSMAWDGNNDTSSLEKDIFTVVHATFELE
jgi:hypothetical protein